MLGWQPWVPGALSPPCASPARDSARHGPAAGTRVSPHPGAAVWAGIPDRHGWDPKGPDGCWLGGRAVGAECAPTHTRYT